MTQSSLLEKRSSFQERKVADSLNKEKSSLKNIIKTFKLLILPYWKSEDKYIAGFLLALVVGLNFGYVYAHVLLNQWSGEFYNALQNLNVSEFNSLVIKFVFYIAFIILTFLVKAYIEDFLSFKWRNWMTHKFIERWLADKAFYKSLQQQNAVDNPDQRISQDISNFTRSILDFATSILSSVVNLITFSFILWTLSPEFSIPLGEESVLSIPGYMLWLTIIYCLIATYIVFKIGKPLIKLDFISETKEANFRYSLMRIVERRDEVALLNGEKQEKKQLDKKFYEIKENYFKKLVQFIYINTAQNLFSNASSVFPLLAAAPAFFAGTITLGTLMQLSSAFNYVQSSLMLFADRYQSLAAISAMASRLNQLHQSTEPQKAIPAINKTIDDTLLEVNNLTIYKPNQTAPLLKINFSLKAGQKLMIQGRSGIGKTTLIKTIAGIWPHASGAITRPELIDIMPQKPYFPIGSLKEAILYGNDKPDIADKEIEAVLETLGLSHLSQDLNLSSDWNAKLSLGEQQRLSIVRIIIKKPKWLILDEPTASLDKENQVKAMQTLFKHLPETAVLTISHSASLAEYHDSTLLL